jgi:hypothetical protein
LLSCRLLMCGGHLPACMWQERQNIRHRMRSRLRQHRSGVTGRVHKCINRRNTDIRELPCARMCVPTGLPACLHTRGSDAVQRMHSSVLRAAGGDQGGVPAKGSGSWRCCCRGTQAAAAEAGRLRMRCELRTSVWNGERDSWHKSARVIRITWVIWRQRQQKQAGPAAIPAAQEW